MPSAAVAAYGTLLGRGVSPSSPDQLFTTIGEVKNITGPSTELSIIDVTTHSSAASGNFREKLPSLIDSGTIDFDINYVPTDATIQAIRTDLASRNLRQYRLLTPLNAAGVSSNCKFNAYVTAMPLEFPTDDVMGGSVTLTITGGVTWTP